MGSLATGYRQRQVTTNGATNGASHDSARYGPLGITARRRPMLAMTGAVMVALSVAVAALAYQHAGRKTDVLVVARRVAQGATLQAADLSPTAMGIGSGVQAIPAAAEPSILNRRAAVTLLPGTLLVPQALTDAPALGAGQSVVGVGLKVGQLPADGLNAGDHVEVVFSPPPGSAPAIVPTPAAGSAGTAGAAPSSAGTAGTTASVRAGGTAGSAQGTPSAIGENPSAAWAGTVLVTDATVFSAVPPPQDSGGGAVEDVSIVVPAGVAPEVATAAAADQITLVLIPGGGK